MVYLLTRFIPTQYLIEQLLEVFPHPNYKAYLITHYRIVLQVQTPIIHPSITQNQQNTNSFSTSHTSKILPNPRSQTSILAYATIRTNPHIDTTSTQPFTSPQNIFPNPSITPTYNTVPISTTPKSTIATPVYTNSSTTISEPIKPFDGLDHNYTSKEYLQHIDALVTFSLGLQPTSDHEY